MNKEILSVTLGLMFLLSMGCGSDKQSGRDARREQIRNNADSKRKELSSVIGYYYGNLVSENIDSKGVTLNLEIKDIPQEVEGEIDPVMIPTLSGYIKFNYGSTELVVGEQINFKLTKAIYDAKTDRIDLVASNEVFKDIVFTLQTHKLSYLSGSWSAPDISKAGDVEFLRSIVSGGEANLIDFISPPIAGEYQGYIHWDKKGVKQLASLTLVSALNPPDGIRLEATARIFLGDINSNEFVTYKYNDVHFNPIDGKLTINDILGSDVTFSGTLSNGIYTGRWSNRYDGDAGESFFQKSSKFLNIDRSIITKLSEDTFSNVTHIEVNKL